jgi:Abnormal spindle-like microcephaly-assoc'd, ASPM-SPD-2-Hydin
MHARYFLGLTVLLGAIAIGCGGGSGNGAHQDVAAGQLSVSPSTLAFGQVQVGQKVTKTGTIKAGNARITVSSADWSGEGFSVTGISFPLTVAAGQSVPFNVTFAPQKGGSSSGKISFLSDASNSPNRAAFSANASVTSAGSAHRVTLSWRANSASAAGYNIYRGVSPSGPFSKINSSPHPNSTFTDTSVQGGETYFYITTALNQKGKESKPSNKVQVTIPNS